jgi:hypothetical protein
MLKSDKDKDKKNKSRREKFYRMSLENMGMFKSAIEQSKNRNSLQNPF